MNNPYEAFYHGLVASKIWLCEKIEPIIDTYYKEPTINILGGWHNVISFMLLVRRPNYYKVIHSFDIDDEATCVANKICDTWKFEKPHVYNHTQDVNLIDFSSFKNEVFINCSVDQIVGTDWYKTIPAGCLICLQTTDIMDENPRWEINQRTANVEELLNRYPMSNVIFTGSKRIQYPEFGYNRLMAIGIK